MPSATTAAAFDPAYFAALARVEDRHFWFRARNRLIAEVASAVTRQYPQGYRVLEVGCGNGNVLRHLAKACPDGLTVGMDFFDEGLRFARVRTSCPLVRGDARLSPFGRRFQIVGMFDVLEHIDDDARMLRDAYSFLEPGGALLLTVPAGKALWSYFDEASHHFRRYEPSELTQKLRNSGFEIEHLSHFMCAIYPLLWMNRRFQQDRRGGAQSDPGQWARREFNIVPVINELLSAFLTLETSWVSRGRRLPFGTSLLAVARRPAGS